MMLSEALDGLWLSRVAYSLPEREVTTAPTMMDSLLEEITSRDAVRVWASSCAIIKLRDSAQLHLLASQLEAIRAATENLELGGMLIPNTVHLNLALRKLDYHRQGAGCLCRLYQ
jgi:hypothetical protein